MAVGRFHGGADLVAARRAGGCLDQALARGRRYLAVGGIAQRGREIVGQPVEIGVDALHDRPPLGHAGSQLAAQRGDALAGRRRHRQHPHAAETIGHQEPAEIIDASRAGGRVEPVDLVEEHHRHRAVPGELAQVLVMKRGVGVLLRIDHPREDVDHLHEPIDLGTVSVGRRIVVGQIEQHQTLELTGHFAGRQFAGADRPDGAGRPETLTVRHGEPVEQRVGAVAEHRGERGGCRRPAHTDSGQLGTGDRVEQRRLPAARRAGEGDDRVARAVSEPGGCGAERLPRPVLHLGGQAAGTALDHLAEEAQPGVQVVDISGRTSAAHKRTASAIVDARARRRAGASSSSLIAANRAS